MYFDDVFRNYWWLLFPLAFFVFGMWDRWLVYKRSRDHLELLKTYQAQGKEPPPERVRAAGYPYADPAGWGPPPYGAYGYGRRAWRRYYRWGPYWQWRSVFFTAAVAAGFWVAADWADLPGTEHALRLVAIIVGFVAAANLLSAIFSSVFRPR